MTSCVYNCYIINKKRAEILLHMELITFVCFVAYTCLLFGITYLTGRKATNDTFFRGNRKSPWIVVAYGMLGASLSGVTFMSVPGGVYYGQFTYLPLVLGYVLGYAVIALILLPTYYKLNLTSIYTYLEHRFGRVSEGTGALFFIVSRLLGSALRMYLMVFVLYEFVFRGWGIPFWVPAVIFIALILLYTFRGGLRTIVWTDTLQTTFLLLAAILSLTTILKNMDMDCVTLLRRAGDAGLTQVWETDPGHARFWLKQVLAGAFITIAMTGLDQDMMQKNLTCRTLRDAQKNVMTSSILFIIVNILFLCLGAALVFYARESGVLLPTDASGHVVGDKIFPTVAFGLSNFTAILFTLGLVAAGYSSADGSLTALTTSFCYDFLHFDQRYALSAAGQAAMAAGADHSHLSAADQALEAKRMRIRKGVHIGFAVLYLLVILAFRPLHTDSLINQLFDIAGFTYGPLLGLFTFGLFTRWQVRDRWVPLIAVASPVICYILKLNSPVWFGYTFGFEILLLNGLLTFLGLCLAIRKNVKCRM